MTPPESLLAAAANMVSQPIGPNPKIQARAGLVGDGAPGAGADGVSALTGAASRSARAQAPSRRLFGFAILISLVPVENTVEFIDFFTRGAVPLKRVHQ